ncbi:hypothetical protein [Marinobacter sp.]|uniref:hypothetical protein n=1 Tax=Marinobacter sp. TaxID=50741 RepID=UPI002B47DC39|nr:hypothetical protein [Marinobacter sp.]HKK54728.1 hypothetical protein [Marinobacter sp.]
MQNPDLPTLPTLALEQTSHIPETWEFAADAGLVLLIPRSERKNLLAGPLAGSPWGAFLAARLAGHDETANPVVTSGPQGHRIVVGFLADDTSSFKTLALPASWSLRCSPNE